MVRTIYQQPSPDEVHAQLDRVTDQLGDRFPQVASLLDEAGPDILAFSSFPVAHWKKIWSNNPLERLNKEIRRRTDVVGISSGPHHQDSGEAKIRECTAGVSRKPSSDGKACGCSSKHLCGLTAWNT